jgi:hypothetical protein
MDTCWAREEEELRAKLNTELALQRELAFEKTRKDKETLQKLENIAQDGVLPKVIEERQREQQMLEQRRLERERQAKWHTEQQRMKEEEEEKRRLEELSNALRREGEEMERKRIAALRKIETDAQRSLAEETEATLVHQHNMVQRLAKEEPERLIVQVVEARERAKQLAEERAAEWIALRKKQEQEDKSRKMEERAREEAAGGPKVVVEEEKDSLVEEEERDLNEIREKEEKEKPVDVSKRPGIKKGKRVTVDTIAEHLGSDSALFEDSEDGVVATKDDFKKLADMCNGPDDLLRHIKRLENRGVRFTSFGAFTDAIRVSHAERVAERRRIIRALTPPYSQIFLNVAGQITAKKTQVDELLAMCFDSVVAVCYFINALDEEGQKLPNVDALLDAVFESLESEQSKAKVKILTALKSRACTLLPPKLQKSITLFDMEILPFGVSGHYTLKAMKQLQMGGVQVATLPELSRRIKTVISEKAAEKAGKLPYDGVVAAPQLDVLAQVAAVVPLDMETIDQRRGIVVERLAFPQCSLFTGVRDTLEVREDEIDRLIQAAGGSTRACVQAIDVLDRENLRFSRVEQLISAIKKMRRTKTLDEQEIKTGLTAPAAVVAMRQAVSSALSYPRCQIFANVKQGLTVTNRDLDQVIGVVGGSLDRTLAVIVDLDKQGFRCNNMSALREGVRTCYLSNQALYDSVDPGNKNLLLVAASAANTVNNSRESSVLSAGTSPMASAKIPASEKVNYTQAMTILLERLTPPRCRLFLDEKYKPKALDVDKISAAAGGNFESVTFILDKFERSGDKFANVDELVRNIRWYKPS